MIVKTPDDYMYNLGPFHLMWVEPNHRGLGGADPASAPRIALITPEATSSAASWRPLDRNLSIKSPSCVPWALQVSFW
jgi:hypothetical protein